MLRTITKQCLFVILCLLSFQGLAFQESTETSYIGSQQCSSCHQQQYKKWQQSHHFRAMESPDKTSVLGNFNNATFLHKGVKSTFFSREGTFFVSVTEGNGPTQEYPVAYTFGFYPLQQYLLDIGNGKLQAYNVAWDSRPTSAGGQRWFQLLEDQANAANSEFNWDRHLYNWNSRCAECHSTNVVKNYDPDSLSYQTSFEEINVGCEACHGPGSLHQQLVQTNQYKKTENTGFSTQLTAVVPFQFSNDSPIAQAANGTKAKDEQSKQVNACGGCHSRRQVIGAIDPAKPYHDQFRLSLIHDPLYFADGQIQDEVFVLGSFMQSKMYQQGVTCTHCHDAHSGETLLPDNALCSQCHAANTYATPQHHKHSADSPGSQCVNCHMPETVYMGVDPRRDHSFSIPSSAHDGDTPNACQQCHDSSTQGWSKHTDAFSKLNDRARKADTLALRDMNNYINAPQYPDIRKATLLDLAAEMPARLTVETITQQLQSTSALLRRSAVDASRFLPLDMRWSLLNPYIDDPSADVRFSVAEQLAPTLQHLNSGDAARLQKLLNEHRAQMTASEDMASGQAAIANFALASGKPADAIASLKRALKIEPNYLPAHLNLADIYRSQHQPVLEKQHLDKAIALDPDNAAAQHAYGLFLIRQKQTQNALAYLRRATEVEPTQVRFFYVYAVALDSVMQTQQAIETLQQANQRWPNHYNILLALVEYLEKSQREKESWPYLSTLSAIAPNDPAIKGRVERLRAKTP